MSPLYAPTRRQIYRVAEQAVLRNHQQAAKDWLLRKIEDPSPDWDGRTFYTVPGLVWTVGSDTCMTGRLSAPDNIAYDTQGREFVYRQPADAGELAAIMSADSEEVFSCYRFDGLERWNGTAFEAWVEGSDVIVGWVEQLLNSEFDERDEEIRESLQACHEYLTGEDFYAYLAGFGRLLEDHAKG